MQSLRFIAPLQNPTLLEIQAEGKAITGLKIISPPLVIGQEEKGKATGLLLEAKKQILEYLSGSRKEFTLPLATSGTSFQEQVWEALQKIPYGNKETYKGVATKIQNEKACQAVGGANSKNPLPILIPCHRVTGSKGKLQGYSFGGVETQQFLLELETKK